MRTPLQIALFEAGIPQYRIAQRAGIDETRLSRVAVGRIKPTPDERRRIAAAVGKAEAELFEDEPASDGGGE